MYSKDDSAFIAPNEECPWYCEDPEDKELPCTHQHPDYGYFCTRTAGHDGPHVACGREVHAYAQWPQEKLH